MESLTNAKSINRLFLFFSVIVIGGLLYLLAPILTPFLSGALLAYLVNPLVNQLVRLHIPRLLSVSIIFLVLLFIIVLLIFLLIPLIQEQLINLFHVMTNTVAWAQNNILPWIMTKTNIHTTLSADVLKTAVAENWSKAGGAVTVIWKTVLHSGFALIEWVTNLLLIPVVTFYLLRDWDSMLRRCRDFLPRNVEPTVVQLATECDTVLSAFFRGQLLVMILLGVIYSIGLTLIGLQVGLIIGLISGLLCIVPYLGFIVGIAIASIAAFLQFGTFSSIAFVWVVFLIGQALESFVLTPKLVGHRIGLHPVAVIFSILLGGSLFGFFGVLLALPVAAVIMVCLRFLDQHYRASHLYQ
jgi:predicted PurR-regulated permease PerM